MANFFLRLKLKKDMYIISKASLISLFIFLFSAYLSSILLPNLSIAERQNIVLILAFILFSIILVLSYVKIPMKILTKLEEFYPEVPFIIIGIGCLALLIAFSIVSKYPNVPDAPIVYQFIGGILILLSIPFIPFGIILLIITLAAKRSLESRVFFTLKKANAILDNVEDKNKIDTKNLKRYIYLTYKNIKTKIGKELKLEPPNKSDGVSALDIEYTFLNYLPYYIEFGGKEQLQSLKNSLETMLNSVNEKDEINWRSLTPVILKLNDDIITYLRESNFNLTYKKLPRRSEWILKNKDTIVQAIGLIVPIILFILAKLYPPKVP